MRTRACRRCAATAPGRSARLNEQPGPRRVAEGELDRVRAGRADAGRASSAGAPSGEPARARACGALGAGRLDAPRAGGELRARAGRSAVRASSDDRARGERQRSSEARRRSCAPPAPALGGARAPQTALVGGHEGGGAHCGGGLRSAPTMPTAEQHEDEDREEGSPPVNPCSIAARRSGRRSRR